ncbi:MAG: pyridoxine 5'-phosphate synthase [Phycisphaerae bacterium]|nr:pyridoxine 5'-phosphate synthase [Phycisphaerae bacterium]
MIALGVNIDHVATVRQARRTYEPDPVAAAAEAILGGADGITVHLREDRRHIQDSDVLRLRSECPVKLNFEMAAVPPMVEFACRVKPAMAMLVPEGRHEVTTEGGLDVVANEASVREVIARLRDAGIQTSIFLDADPAQIEAAARVRAQVCEVHTGPYAHAAREWGIAQGGAASDGLTRLADAARAEYERVRAAGEQIQAAGMQFNAGHALNYDNVRPIAALAGVRELHIGHAIVSRAIFVGLRAAVSEMKALMVEGAAAQGVHSVR